MKNKLMSIVVVMALFVAGCSGTTTPAITTTSTVTATSTITATSTPTATLEPTETPSPTVTATQIPDDFQTVSGEFANKMIAGTSTCTQATWEDMGFTAPNNAAIVKKDFSEFGTGKVYCAVFFLIFPSPSGGVGWLVYKDTVEGTVVLPFTYDATWAELLTQGHGWTTPTPSP